MSREAKAERKPKKGITTAEVASIIAWLQQRDLALWIAAETAKRSRHLCGRDLGLKIPPKVFKECIDNSCQWFRKTKRHKLTQTTLLNHEQWERLSATVADMRVVLQGHTRRECAFMVNSRCPCNEMLLQGLTSDYHVWSDAKKRDPNAPWYAY